MRGGQRQGAGRPLGAGKFGLEKVKQIRVPVARITEVYQFLANEVKTYALPLYSSAVQAGFPSPADDYIERYLDLNAEFIKNPAATFLLRASGDSMKDAGIFSGDTLVVDRSIKPRDKSIVIAAVNGELTVKRLSYRGKHVQLLPANPEFTAIDITEDHDMVIWGVVILVLHKPD
tara:strand:+ start:1348 stop:1872 length:525 start_codon:yes stop_codon:yes gene_type:complete